VVWKVSKKLHLEGGELEYDGYEGKKKRKKIGQIFNPLVTTKKNKGVRGNEEGRRWPRQKKGGETIGILEQQVKMGRGTTYKMVRS